MAENTQKAHYEAMHDEYEQHYYDDTSLQYRRRFIFRPALQGIDLAGKRVADIACGSGWNTLLLRELFPTARFEGFDISAKACADYERNTGFKAHEQDLSVSGHSGEKFDAAIVIGGLHHMVNDLPAAVAGIAEMLKSGGVLIAYEPNADFFLNRVRATWYKADKYFEEDTERAISLHELQKLFADKMQLIDSHAVGGPAYIAILNSMILRIPLAMKRPLAKALYLTEVLYNILPGSAPYPAFISRWRKR